MQDIEMLYFEKEKIDIKEWCEKSNNTLKYNNKIYYLYEHKIFDSDFNVIIENAENGFLDLF